MATKIALAFEGRFQTTPDTRRHVSTRSLDIIKFAMARFDTFRHVLKNRISIQKKHDLWLIWYTWTASGAAQITQINLRWSSAPAEMCKSNHSQCMQETTVRFFNHHAKYPARSYWRIRSPKPESSDSDPLSKNSIPSSAKGSFGHGCLRIWSRISWPTWVWIHGCNMGSRQNQYGNRHKQDLV